MKFLDRYLYAVGRHLPQNRRDDILAELRANLLEEAEDKEAQMGRALTPAEEEVLLKHLGHPAVVASRYLPQRYLIGPSVFPFYLLVLRTFLPIVFLLYAISGAAGFIHQPFSWLRLQGLLLNLPLVLIQATLWITALVALLEFAQAKYFERLAKDWTPSKLPPPETMSERSGVTSVFEIMLGGVFLLCLLFAPHLAQFFLTSGPRELRAEPAPVWHVVYWIWIVLFSAQWLIDICAFFSTGWRRIRPVLGVVGQSLFAASFWLLSRSKVLFELSDAGRSMPDKQAMIETMNQNVARGLRVAFIAVLLFTLLRIFKILSHRTNASRRVAALL